MSFLGANLVRSYSYDDIVKYNNIEDISFIGSDISSRDETYTTEDVSSRSYADNSGEYASNQHPNLLTQTLHYTNCFVTDCIKSEKNFDVGISDEITTDYVKLLNKDQLLSISTVSNRTLFQNVASNPNLIKALHHQLKSLLHGEDITLEDIMSCLMYDANGLTALAEASYHAGSLTAFSDLIRDLNLLYCEENIIAMKELTIRNIDYLIDRLYIDNSIDVEIAYCINNLREFGINLGLFVDPLIP